LKSERITARRIDRVARRDESLSCLLSSVEPKPRRVAPAGFPLSGVANQMTEYWVFQGKSFKRACIHRSNCSVRQGALNKPGCSEGTWHGAFPTYEYARRTAAVMSPQKGAQLKLPPLPPANF